MELRQLRYFVMVAETLHFGRAAERLNMTQPPLSQQIRALEEELGLPLFLRANRRIQLTEAGSYLLERLRPILRALNEVTTGTREVHHGTRGELRIGFTASAPFTDAISRTILAFREERPALRLILREMTSIEQVAALLRHELHVAILRPLTLPPELSHFELLREPLTVCMRSSHPAARDSTDEQPVSLRSFADDHFLLVSRQAGVSIHDQVMDLCRRAGYSPQVVQEASQGSTLIALVAAGLGVAVVPASMRRIQVPGVVYRVLDDPGAQTSVWVAWHVTERTPAVRAFLAAVSRHLA